MNDHINIIRKKGLKITGPRYKIIKLLSNHKKPVTAKEIFNGIKSKIDLSTVYRTLHILEKKGIVFREEINRESYFYLSGKHHHHVVCRRCGYTKCIPCSNDFSGIENFSDIEHRLTLTGLCNECQNK